MFFKVSVFCPRNLSGYSSQISSSHFPRNILIKNPTIFHTLHIFTHIHVDTYTLNIHTTKVRSYCHYSFTTIVCTSLLYWGRLFLAVATNLHQVLVDISTWWKGCAILCTLGLFPVFSSYKLCRDELSYNSLHRFNLLWKLN